MSVWFPQYQTRRASYPTRAPAERSPATPELMEFLKGAASWSSFAASLFAQASTKGGLSAAQMNAALSMQAKSEARAEQKSALAVAEETADPTLAKLAAAFLSSSAHLKHPKLRLETEDGKRVVLSRCGARSRTEGHINVTDGGGFGSNVYYGRITPDGKALYRSATPQSVIALLAAFDANPQAEILVQGKRTGCCCLCGRELSDPESLARGVGPVCAKKWGL